MQLVDPRIQQDWNEQVLTIPQASIFHSVNWLQVLQASYGYQPYYLAACKGQQLSLLLPFMEVKSWITGVRGVSLPFADYCGPIGNSSTPYEEVMKQVLPIAYQQRWKFFEVRGGDVLWHGVTPYTFYYGHQLPLGKDDTEVFSGLRGNYRARIRKALMNHLIVTMCHDAEAIEEYYRLHCLTRKRQGLPPQPVRFFRHIYEYIIAQKFGSVVLVSSQGRNVAGGIFFFFGTRAFYKFGASDIKYQSLFPNYLLFWHVIQWLCQHGYTELCFGRSDPFHRGLIQFKDGWGAKKYKINYYRYDMQTSCFIQKEGVDEQYSRKLWQKTPVLFLKLAGSMFYKHIG